MTKLIKLSLLLLVFLFTSASATFAQTAQDHGVTFPVAELGNCASLAECRSYCDDPLNKDACIEFAKKKGFYKEERKTAVKNALNIAAQAELGCDSESACKQFCSDQANFQKCGEFARKHNLGGGKVSDPASTGVITQAKQILGCDSKETCQGFCEKEENKSKCDEFAKLVGLKGGVERKGPGGCTSKETCEALCSLPENFSICQGFAQAKGAEFKGPGGCNSEGSCKTYCQQNEAECSKYFQGKEGRGGPSPRNLENVGFNKEAICNRTPSCRWTDNQCVCQRGENSGPQGVPAYQNADDKAKFCRENPERCQIQKAPSSEDLAKKCAAYGCSWTGSTCKCENRPGPQYNIQPQPTGVYSPPPTTYSPPPTTEQKSTTESYIPPTTTTNTTTTETRIE